MLCNTREGHTEKDPGSSPIGCLKYIRLTEDTCDSWLGFAGSAQRI